MSRMAHKAWVPAMALLVVATVATTEARLTNVITDWINATQAAVTVTGSHNVPASRYYALVALSIHKSIAKGGAPPAALAGEKGMTHYPN